MKIFTLPGDILVVNLRNNTHLPEQVTQWQAPESHGKVDLVALMHKIRALDLKKAPSISETLDWARSLMALNADDLEEDVVNDTLNVILKYEGDVAKAQNELSKMLEQRAAKPPQPEADPAPAEEKKKGILH